MTKTTDSENHLATTTLLDVTGMHCASCAARVQDALCRTSSVESAEVNFATGCARIVSTANPEHLIQAVIDAGYQAVLHVPDESNTAINPGAPPSDVRKGIEVFAALTGAFGVMIMSMHSGFSSLPREYLAIVAFLVMAWPGRDIYLVTWRLIKRGGVNMDTLIAVGSGAAFIGSLVNLFRNRPDLYFDSAAMIVAIVLLGRHLEERARSGAQTAVKALLQLRQPTVRKVDVDGNEVEVATSSLEIDDLFMISSGESAATDGELVQGVGEMDESMITGESMPVLRRSGDKVIGGSVQVGSQRLLVKATAIGEQTILSSIVRMVDQAQSSKPRIQKLADRISGVFVPAVIALAVMTGLAALGLSGLSAEQAFMRTIAVLVIACPCALGLATPLAVVALIGRAARSGILIRNADVLEPMVKVDHVVFDKTGTLTEGVPEVIKVIGEPQSAVAKEAWAGQVLAVAQSSTHPLSLAIRNFIQEKGFSHASRVHEVKEYPGDGVELYLDQVGQVLKGRMGRHDWVAELASGESYPETSEDGAFARVDVCYEGGSVSTFFLKDALRSSAKQGVACLQAAGIKPIIASGDRSMVVHELAVALGDLESHAEYSPQDKIRFIESLQQGGAHVAMIGDGVNDAPALAQADLGVAIGAATDVAASTAQILIPQGDLKRVHEALILGKRALVIMKQNLFWAFAYNVLAIPAAAIGLLSPMVAAGAMTLSSLTVVLNSSRLRHFR